MSPLIEFCWPDHEGLMASIAIDYRDVSAVIEENRNKTTIWLRSGHPVFIGLSYRMVMDTIKMMHDTK